MKLYKLEHLLELEDDETKLEQKLILIPTKERRICISKTAYIFNMMGDFIYEEDRRTTYSFIVRAPILIYVPKHFAKHNYTFFWVADFHGDRSNHKGIIIL